MTKNNRTRPGFRPLAVAALAAAVLGALALSQQASAAGFQLKENDVKSMGRAYAGSQTAGDDAAVVSNNPAAMSALKGTQFQADITAINVSAKFSGGGTDALGRPLTGGNGGDAGDLIPVPAFDFVTQVGDRWHLGVGVHAPYGFKTEYDRDWVGRYQAVKSDIKVLDAVFSASYDVTDKFALGFSAIAQRTSAELTQAINFGTILALNPAVPPGLFLPQSADGYGRLKGDDWGYGWQVGAYWRLSDADTLAASYRSKINHTITGNAEFTVPAQVRGVFALNPLTAGLFTNTKGTADFDTPAYAELSYWHKVNDAFGLGADLGWTKWDSLQTLVVDYDNPAQPNSTEVFDYKNAWFVSFGGEYALSDQLSLRAGVAYDKTPTRDATRDPRVPDNTRKWLSLGLGYKPTANTEFNLGYSHLFVSDASINDTSPTGDHLVGKFSDKGDLFGVSGRFVF
ncbi:Long-chain fatty acid transport protein [Mizugakiibacter sediminis]|uniref:Long-chain fatty acid transport protein n=1 Tax=Mizugakiibacter sediminis TaxID=1475481 RepID=A0A0K8QKX7_9GAMM|nr:outer membrane protein transport protein [Mizugakiibacter sediminis]GAP65326.1 Long-chain fatty acid transport protein [Mizugakiibacter sediminis]